MLLGVLLEGAGAQAGDTNTAQIGLLLLLLLHLLLLLLLHLLLLLLLHLLLLLLLLLLEDECPLLVHLLLDRVQERPTAHQRSLSSSSAPVQAELAHRVLHLPRATVRAYTASF
jgi:hypothetical protein